MVKDWDTAVPGAVTEGVVVKITDSGLLVQLWGELRGWVPKSQLSTETIDMPEKIFWLGQAVKCRVMDADPAKDKISLSLILDTVTVTISPMVSWSSLWAPDTRALWRLHTATP